MATTTAKASERVIAGPLAWIRRREWGQRDALIAMAGLYVPNPGRSVTRARRLYVSRLANFRVSDPRYGAAHKDVRAMDGAYGGHPAPTLGAYTVSLLCVV